MPVTRSSHWRGGAAIIPSLHSQIRNPRPSINTQDLETGYIVWLPRKSDDDERIKCVRVPCCSNQDLQEGGYNHPVVVLKVGLKYFGDAVCFSVQVTSKERNHRFGRIRISHKRPPQQPYGDNTIATELYLENGIMDRQSYVVLEHIFQVPASQLRLCSFRSGSRAYDSRICEQSYNLLMARLGLAPEGWVHTILLELGITRFQETPFCQSTEQSRTLGSSDDFLTQPLAQQILQPGHTISRPIQPAAGTDPVFSSPYRCTEESLFFANYTPSRMPGEWDQQPVNRDLHYDLYGGCQEFEQSGCAPPSEDNSGDVKVFFEMLVVLLVVGIIFWWHWYDR